MSPPEPDTIDNQLCFSLYSASLAMTQVYKPLLEPLGLTYPQYLVMLILWERDGRTLKEVATVLGQKSGALTPVLKRLEADGLVQRVRDKSDERALNLQLTEKGDGLREQASSIGPNIYQALGLSFEELADLKKNLEIVRKNLNDYRNSIAQ